MENSKQLEIEAPPGEPVVITRRFVEAPPEVLFAMWTTPEHLMQWWGPDWNTLDECEVDLRVGGTHRYVSSNDEGEKFRFHGEFVEIEPNRRLKTTWVFEGPPAQGSIDSITFAPVDGGTLVTTNMRLASVEERDSLPLERMTEGMDSTFRRLDAYLERQ